MASPEADNSDEAQKEDHGADRHHHQCADRD
jgi:hypothetical protein